MPAAGGDGTRPSGPLRQVTRPFVNDSAIALQARSTYTTCDASACAAARGMPTPPRPATHPRPRAAGSPTPRLRQHRAPRHEQRQQLHAGLRRRVRLLHRWHRRALRPGNGPLLCGRGGPHSPQFQLLADCALRWALAAAAAAAASGRRHAASCVPGIPGDTAGARLTGLACCGRVLFACCR
jgi:hypothetical protein